MAHLVAIRAFATPPHTPFHFRLSTFTSARHLTSNDSHLCSFCQLRLFITLVLLLVICLFVALKTFATRHASHFFCICAQCTLHRVKKTMVLNDDGLRMAAINRGQIYLGFLK